MKNFFKVIGLLGVSILSFYYTEKVALYVKENNPIYIDLEDLSDSKYVLSEDSVLVDDIYIIPGLNGKKLNIDASFKNVKNGEIRDDLLIFSQVEPKISLADNMDKIIIRGDEKKNSVAIIFEEINDVSEHAITKNYQIDLLISEEKYNPNYEMINDAKNEEVYSNIDKYLTKNKLNMNLCLVSDKESSNCQGKFLVKPSLILNHSNISANLSKISSGEILFISKTLTLDEFKLVLSQIKYKNLQVVRLSSLISEINEK